MIEQDQLFACINVFQAVATMNARIALWTELDAEVLWSASQLDVALAWRLEADGSLLVVRM